jgi:hypothetical protein
VTGSILASGIIAEGSGGMTWKGTIWGMLSVLTYTTFIFLSSSVEKDTPVVQKSSLFTLGACLPFSSLVRQRSYSIYQYSWKLHRTVFILVY